jgi:hypothetical protein
MLTGNRFMAHTTILILKIIYAIARENFSDLRLGAQIIVKIDLEAIRLPTGAA